MRIKKLVINPLLKKTKIITARQRHKCTLMNVPILKGQKCLSVRNGETKFYSKGTALRMIEEAKWHLEELKRELLFDNLLSDPPGTFLSRMSEDA